MKQGRKKELCLQGWKSDCVRPWVLSLFLSFLMKGWKIIQRCGATVKGNKGLF